MHNSKLSNQHTNSGEEPILSVEGLTTHYETDDEESIVQAAEDISFSVNRGETIGLVGESGCGKSTVGLSLIRALPPQGSIVDGIIHFDGRDITTLGKKEIKKIQWNQISMIYQGAQNAFNPVKTIDKQIREALAKHNVVPKSEQRGRIEELLQKVDLDPSIADRYPHELSGGMKQRAAIAMAISCEPDLLIADEPTTALDVVVQAKVLRMLLDLQEEFNFGMVVVSHNLAAIMKVANKIGVMYAGNMVERASAVDIYEDPQHPYTAKLFNSIIDPKQPPKRVENIPGTPPDLRNPPDGCRFAPRCELATDECRDQKPPFEPVADTGDHFAACYYSEEVSR